MKNTFFKLLIVFLLMFSFGKSNLFAQIPYVYTIENTGAKFKSPKLPTIDKLPLIAPLPDPFAWAEKPLGSNRSTLFRDWEHHRAEIKAQIENYEIGLKPAVDPSQVTASYSNGVLTVNVTVNGNTLVLTSKVVLPSGSGPFPAVIGMNNSNGSLPASFFTSRNIAQITFSHNQVTTYNKPQNTDPYYKLYPNLTVDNTGQYSAWAWGVSRLIDGLEKLQGVLPIDIKHIAVTGCSYAGKMALFAGAFDERIALTIPQESGGGGATSWRYSQTLATGSVEGLAQTSRQWFAKQMFQFSGDNVSYFPEDHHMLMALCAPRALYVTGNTDYLWLSNQSNYVCSRAVQQIYRTLGIADRFGFGIDGGHGHCQFPTGFNTDLDYFLDKFMLGKTELSKVVEVYPESYSNIDFARWYKWWGTGKAVFPAEKNVKKIYLEAECATVGANWDVISDIDASNGKYVMVKPGLNSIAKAPTGTDDAIVFPFTVDIDGTFNIFARVSCSTPNSDSYWVKIDNGQFAKVNGFGKPVWSWTPICNSILKAGSHTLTIAYRQDGNKIDKILVTNSEITPTGKGSAAVNCVIIPK